MHHGNVCFRYTKQDGTIRRATGTLIGYEHSFRRPYTPKPENTFASITTSMPKAGAPFMLKIFWISKWNEPTRKRNESDKNEKSREALCRQYNVDSLTRSELQGWTGKNLEFLHSLSTERLPNLLKTQDEDKQRTYR